MSELVTVVIPVWDKYARFVAEAVGSVDGDQTRILLVDNASSEAVSAPPGVDIVRAPERLSVGAARNLGIENVQTKYVLVMDVDDKLMPHTVEYLSRRMESNPAISICATAILDSDTGRRHRNPRRFVRFVTRSPRTFAFFQCVWSFLPIQGCALLRTQQVLDAGGYPDTDWGDDWVLATSLAFRGRVEVSERLGRYYRATPGSLRASRGVKDDLASARLVRVRIRSDRGISPWATALMPVITVLQTLIVFAVRPALVAARSLQGSG